MIWKMNFTSFNRKSRLSIKNLKSKTINLLIRYNYLLLSIKGPVHSQRMRRKVLLRLAIDDRQKSSSASQAKGYLWKELLPKLIRKKLLSTPHTKKHNTIKHSRVAVYFSIQTAKTIIQV